MEFHEKLQALRKQRGLTQEELAQLLFVSRTAVSKWESGRGYPSIDSLKAIAGVFSVSLDDLLSSDALLTLAAQDQAQREAHSRALGCGLLDCSAGLLAFLPFFGDRSAAPVQAVPLLSLAPAAPYLKPVLLAAVLSQVLCGIAALALQNAPLPLWQKYGQTLSASLNAAGILLFVACLQPYAAIFSFALLLIKALLRRKQP